jgi:hypothetical protein
LVVTTDYVIAAQSGRMLMLAKDKDDPMTAAVVYSPDAGLSEVAPALQHLRFGLWVDYTGDQDALVGVVPDTIFPD